MSTNILIDIHNLITKERILSKVSMQWSLICELLLWVCCSTTHGTKFAVRLPWVDRESPSYDRLLIGRSRANVIRGTLNNTDITCVCVFLLCFITDQTTARCVPEGDSKTAVGAVEYLLGRVL